MQNTPDSNPSSRLPPGLIKLCRNIWVGIVVVVASSMVLDIIVGIFSSVAYDLIKELLLQNVFIEVLCLVCLVLGGALVYVINLHDSPDSAILQKSKRSSSLVLRLTYVLLPSLLVVSIVWYVTPLHSLIFPADTGLGVSYAGANVAPVGLCDGSCVIDTMRLNGGLKKEAADQIKLHNNVDRACEYWTWASQDDTADAEAKIDIENYCSAKNVKQFIDLAVVVQLASNDRAYLNGMSRNILQGTYLVQKEYNDTHPEGPHMYLFIANIGDPANNNARQLQQQVAAQILQTADPKNTHKIVSIVGLPYGSDDIVQILSQNGYPMISIAPSNSLSGMAYFRSVAPTFQDETNAVVSFLKSRHRNRIALYSAYGDNYSADLTASFAQSFTGRLVVQNTYTKGSDTSLRNSANVVANAGADAVYFIGSPDDTSRFAAVLHSLNQNIMVVGSDVIYQWVYTYHSGQVREDFNGLFFTAFAYHSPPGTPKDSVPQMVKQYRQMFNPNKYYVGYFYDQPGSDAILTFDAMHLVTEAATDALTTNKKALTTQNLWDALYSLNSSKGFSGQISFANANSTFPDQKAVFVLSIQTTGNKYEGTYSGRY